MRFVQMFHPKTKATVTVAESSVPHHRQKGWVTGGEPPSQDVPDEPDVEPDDPSEEND